MKRNIKTNQRVTTQPIMTLYLIGDESTSKQAIYQHFNLPLQQNQTQQLSIAIKQLTEQTHLQMYDFPTDKILRPALNIYLKILPRPTLILYFLKHESTHKQIWQWIKLLKQNYLDQIIVFVSDAQSYMQREKVISKIGREFDYPVIENICFVKLESSSFDRLFRDIEYRGIKIASAVCLKPTLRQRMNQTVRQMVCRFNKIWKKLTIRGEQSVV